MDEKEVTSTPTDVPVEMGAVTDVPVETDAEEDPVVEPENPPAEEA